MSNRTMREAGGRRARPGSGSGTRREPLRSASGRGGVAAPGDPAGSPRMTMTWRVTRLWHAMRGSLRAFWSRASRVERAGCGVGALLIVSGLAHLGLLLAGGGSWNGPLSMRKAVTFGLSFGLTLISLIWTASFVRLRARTRAWLLGAFTIASAIETALVTLQVWRGVPSHFNVESSLDALIARTLAAGGAVLIATVLTLTIASFRTGDAPISLRVAVRAGFLTLCAALLVGGLMIAGGMRLVFAGQPQLAYATGGTLKPTHGAFMHGVLLLPALAWLLSFTGWPERRRLQIVWLGVGGYAACASAVAAANLAGVAIDRAHPALIAAGCAGALAFAASWLLAIAAPDAAPSAGDS